MTQQGEKTKKVGTRMATAGLIIFVIGFVLCVLPLATTHVDYVGGRMVETQGSPSGFAIIVAIAGLVLAGIGFARRLLAAAERR